MEMRTTPHPRNRAGAGFRGAGRRPGGMPSAMTSRTLRIAALAGALALAACGGGGGGPASGDGPQTPVTEPSAPLVTGLSFDYTLTREGEAPMIAETGSGPLSCPAPGCAARDLRLLSGSSGAGTRDGFGTVTGTTGGPALTETFSGVAATVSGASFMRYGFWGTHGYAAVEIGAGDLTAEGDGPQWSGRFGTAHAWAGGEASGTNPTGTGSATWRGIAEAARAADFARLPGTAELRIADLSRPRIEADIDLDDGAAGIELRWTGMELANGGFSKGAAGRDRIDGRFHGPGHEEAWGVFDTGDYVGAFGARRR